MRSANKKIFLLTSFLVLLSSPLLSLEVSKEVQFTIAHPLKTVTGNCNTIEILDFVPKRQGEIYSAGPFRVIIPLNGMTTGNRNRDSNMLEILGFPAVKEIVARVNPIDARIGKNKMSGTLLINGHEKPFSSDFELSESKETTATGTIHIQLHDFGIEAPKLLLLTVQDDVIVSFKVSVTFQ
ncbi:MAG: YceI family protein [Spirochaetia bacterium]|nr:YceI family protein [Spirochaetia bacterium]